MSDKKKKTIRIVVVIVVGAIVFTFGSYRIQRKIRFTVQNKSFQVDSSSFPSSESLDELGEDWGETLRNLKDLEKEIEKLEKLEEKEILEHEK